MEIICFEQNVDFFSLCFLMKGIIACSIIEIHLRVGFNFPVQSSLSKYSQHFSMPFICVLVYVLCIFFLIIDCNGDVCFSVNCLLLTLNY